MRRPRVLIPVGVLAAAAVAVSVLASGMDGGLVYYYSPDEVAAGEAEAGRVIRVGGTVAPDSVRFSERDGVLRFAMAGGGGGRLPVAVRSAPPRLFAEGRDALVEGRLTGGVLRSGEVIVKHDEEYRPATEEAAR